MVKSVLTVLAIFAAAMFINLGAGVSAHAAKDPIYTSWRDNLGAGGYDVVSFHQGNPIKGNADYVTDWNGARWRFGNQINLDTFLKDPEKYTPAYGGYCAWAVANDKLAKGSPKHWSLVDGRLFLNFNAKIQSQWQADTAGFIMKADKNWPEILD